MKKHYGLASGILTLGLGLWGLNSSHFAAAPPSNPLLLAHRAVHQSFDFVGVENDTCTASRIKPPTHNYLENTLPSIQAAIKYGADIIEIDVHPTTDGEFAVFHDWTLDCRTDGTGRVRDHSSTQLKALDIGFGYTADNGQTYPFRGGHVGNMPMLGEVLTAFPDTQFLINIKSSLADEGRWLLDYLSMRGMNTGRISVYGHQNPIAAIRQEKPDLLTMSRRSAKSCLKKYVALGWSGYVPKACRGRWVAIPENYTYLVWGWPSRFEARLKKHGSKVILMGSHTKARADPAIDTLEQLNAVPEDFGGIIWTNKIELTGPGLKNLNTVSSP